DLGALRRQMAETIERAKANDPKELRREIERLRTELAKLTEAAVKPNLVEVPVLTARTAEDLRNVLSALEAVAVEVKRQIDRVLAAKKPSPSPKPDVRIIDVRRPARIERTPKLAQRQAHGDLPGGALKMLQALRTRHPEIVTRTQLGTL